MLRVQGGGSHAAGEAGLGGAGGRGSGRIAVISGTRFGVLSRGATAPAWLPERIK